MREMLGIRNEALPVCIHEQRLVFLLWLSHIHLLEIRKMK
jgi:hypothetical protein